MIVSDITRLTHNCLAPAALHLKPRRLAARAYGQNMRWAGAPLFGHDHLAVGGVFRSQ